MIELYRLHGGDVSKVAKALGIKPGDVRREITPPSPLRFVPVHDQPEVGLDSNGYHAVGREELRPFIVSCRHAQALWPYSDREKLAAARQKYDAGTHIMVQGRDGCWIIQYLWKRTHVRPPINWFYGAFS